MFIVKGTMGIIMFIVSDSIGIIFIVNYRMGIIL